MDDELEYQQIVKDGGVIIPRELFATMPRAFQIGWDALSGRQQQQLLLTSSQYQVQTTSQQGSTNHTTIPPNPVQTYTEYYHAWTKRHAELSRCHSSTSGNDRQWAKYYAEESSRAAHHFYENPHATSVPFPLPPAPPAPPPATTGSLPVTAPASSSSANKSNSADSVTRYVKRNMERRELENDPLLKKRVQAKIEAQIASAIQNGNFQSKNWDDLPLIGLNIHATGAVSSKSPVSVPVPVVVGNTQNLSSSNHVGKRVKRESDILYQGKLKDDDDVIISAVVESQKHRRRDRRRSTSSTSSRTTTRSVLGVATSVNNNYGRGAQVPVSKGVSSAAAKASANDNDADDDVVLEAVVNEIKLPHNRADCTECNFVNTPMKGVYFNYGTIAEISLWINTNKACCDMCYCYVCDVPTKDCKQWVSSSSRFPKHNHCCAKPNTQPWQSMRKTQKRINRSV